MDHMHPKIAIISVT